MFWLSSAAFFQGQIEQPVRSLTSLLTHEDIPVLVAVNSNGVYVIDDTESVSNHEKVPTTFFIDRPSSKT